MGITLTSPPGSDESSSAATSRAGAPMITLEDVVAQRGGRTVLSVDRLEIPHGVTAVVGPIGSGKST